MPARIAKSRTVYKVPARMGHHFGKTSGVQLIQALQMTDLALQGWVALDGQFSKAIDRWGNRACIAVPLAVYGRPYGRLSLVDTERCSREGLNLSTIRHSRVCHPVFSRPPARPWAGTGARLRYVATHIKLLDPSGQHCRRASGDAVSKQGLG